MSPKEQLYLVESICSNHLMLYTYFKRVVLEQTGYMLCQNFFFFACSLKYYALQITSKSQNLRAMSEKKSPYLPSTTFSTHNYRLVYRVYLALDFSVGLLSHCEDVRF